MRRKWRDTGECLRVSENQASRCGEIGKMDCGLRSEECASLEGQGNEDIERKA